MNRLNKRGFTLVELLATIVILGVIGSIAMISVDKLIDSSQKNECDNILLSIKSATKEYISTNRFNLNGHPKLNEDASTGIRTFELTVDDLINGGFLSSPINDPFEKVPLNPSQLVALTVIVNLNADYTYQDSEIKVGINAVSCELVPGDSAVRFPG